MPENLEVVTEESDGFQMLDHYERLIILRKTSPDAYMLRTSEATRRALFHYERQKGAEPRK